MIRELFRQKVADQEPLALRWIDLPGLVHATRVLESKERGIAPPGRLSSVGRLIQAVLVRKPLPRLLFVLGAPRSGTTFLGDCLGALEDVEYHFEPVGTKRANQHVVRGDWSDRRARVTFETVYRCLLDRSTDARFFADKTPRLCFIVEHLARWFPDALFILINRDGRDVAVSLREKDWYSGGLKHGRREAGGETCGPYPRVWVDASDAQRFQSMSDIRRCISVWRYHTESAQRQLAQLDPARWLEVRYEDLAGQPTAAAERMIRFLGLEDPRQHQAFVEACGAVRTTSVGRWRKALTTDEIEEVHEEAGALLEAMGYPR
ncbi:MAG: sulfotransferase [Planctomycetota bacterium]